MVGSVVVGAAVDVVVGGTVDVVIVDVDCVVVVVVVVIVVVGAAVDGTTVVGRVIGVGQLTLKAKVKLQMTRSRLSTMRKQLLI